MKRLSTRSTKTCLPASLALLLVGCGGGGDDSPAPPATAVDATPPETEQPANPLTRECSLLGLLLGSDCVPITQEDIDRELAKRQAERERTPSAPILSAGEAVALTTTLDWIPPSTTEAGTPLLNLSGYKIAFAAVDETGTTRNWQYLDLDNPGLVTYVLDLPGPGEWAISIRAETATGEHGEFSDKVTVIIDGFVAVPDPIAVVSYGFVTGPLASGRDETLQALFAGMLVSGTFDYDASLAATDVTDRSLDEDALIYAGSISNVAGSANGLDFSAPDGDTVVGNELYRQGFGDILSVESAEADFAGFEVNGYTLVRVRLFWIEGVRGGTDDFGRPLDFLPGDELPVALPDFEGRLALDFTSTSNEGGTVSSTLFFDGLFASPAP